MSECRLPSGTVTSGPPEMIRRFLAQGAKPIVPGVRPDKTRFPGRVRVLAVVHGWMPVLAAGSERMLQHMLAALPKDEFDVKILSFGYSDEVKYFHEGIPVKIGFTPDEPPDIIITHHGPGARVTMDLAEEYGSRVVAVFHNERYDIPDLVGLNADLNVFNTHWVSDAIQLPGMVVHPPLEYERHHVDKTGNAVTLVNLQENKGVRTFERVAGLMNHSFIGVLGTHGKQETGYLESLYNVRVLPVTQDMREIWQRSKVVLMPSEYESYGMVAAEACASGIPVIAHPTPGLLECLGDAGLFIDRDDTDGYVRALNLLLTDPEHYRERSELATLRGLELVSQTQDELSQFVDRMRTL